MKIASEIAGKAYGEYGYSSDATGKTGIDIQVDELESIIAAKLKPVRDALRDQLLVDNDEPCPCPCTCDTCERTRAMIAMLSEDE